MSRLLMASFAAVALISISGCMGGHHHCHSCHGGQWGAMPAHPPGPLDQIRAWRKSMLCGSGCGEVYFGEWLSNPPDCEDPCPEFAGGPCGCRPAPMTSCGCGACDTCCPRIRPFRLIGRLVRGFYGKRYCDHCADDCECGGEYMGGGVIESDCGCSSGETIHLGQYSEAAEKSLQRRRQARVSQAPPQPQNGAPRRMAQLQNAQRVQR